MTLKNQIIANYASQIYMTLVNLLVVPIYQRYMGAEAYGLVGFFSTLFTLFFLLDFGLSLLVQRETARFLGGASTKTEFRALYRAVSLAFWGLGLLGVLVVVFSRGWLAERWFRLEELGQESVQFVLILMAITVGLRWLCGLYRGVLSGAERMVWLSAFNALVGSVRFLGVLIWMWWLGFTIQVFFIFQLGVAVFEIMGLALKTYSFLPKSAPSSWSLMPLRSFLQFGLFGALAAVLNVLYVQMDRLLLSGLLPLSEYGNYSLAVLLSTSVMVVSTPISTVILPRMSRLFAQGDTSELQSVYRLGTRMTSSIAGGGALVLAYCSESVLLAWTGDADFAVKYAPILSCYAVGYGFLALAYFPYYLEAACGTQTWYMWGCLILLVLQIPAVLWAAKNHGAQGVGWVWLGLAAFYLMVWAGVVHRRLSPGQHLRWLVTDILSMNWPAVAGMLVLALLSFSPEGRMQAGAYAVVVGGSLLLANLGWLAWSERAVWRHARGR